MPLFAVNSLLRSLWSPKTTTKRQQAQAWLQPAQIELLESRVLLSISLGTADTFAVLAGQAVTNTGPTVITGDLGVSPGSAVTGFPPGIVVNGTIHTTDAVAAQAESDVTIAYNALASAAVTQDLTGQDLGGLTLTPGVYFFSSSAQLTGTLTLDAQGDPNAEFIFQIGTTLTTASNSTVQLINGADSCDVFWQVGSSATVGTTTTFVGHILALQSITVQTGATVDGSVLARNGSVTLDSNLISVANCLTGEITGYKFDDLNGDGIQQPGDVGFAGLTVELYSSNNNVLTLVATTVTDVNGNYRFDDLEHGTYVVREPVQSGVVQTTTNPAPITLTGNETVGDVTFGDFRLISIGGTKFQDTNGNGVRNIGEGGLAGVTMFLDTNNNGVLNVGERSTVTDANGNYNFANVGPGTYIVREVVPVGSVQTTANPANIVASSGTNVTGVNVGNFQTITIGGTKFRDVNGNGVRDIGDVGAAGVTMFLDTNNNGVLNVGERSTVTDANGNYSFANVGPGTYFVREVLPVGSVQTTVNPATIIASSGTNVTGVNVGNFQTITIGGTKFQDVNGNGVRDIGDVGAAGVTVFLDTNNNGVLNVGERSTVTDANGNYSFASVGPGTYIVREVLPVGSVQTTANPANIITSSGINVTGVNIGNFQTLTIGGTKFQDSNGNGIRDAGEPGLAGFTIFLDTNNNGVLNVGERSTVSGVNGTFNFANLGPGTYIVREVAQSNFVQMTNNPAPITATSGGNVSTILIGNIPLGNVITVGKLLLTGKNLTNLLNGTLGNQANYVANLYQTYLGHAPDIAGLTHYLRLIMAGYTEAQVATMFKADFHLPATPALKVASTASPTLPSATTKTNVATAVSTMVVKTPATLRIQSTIPVQVGRFADQAFSNFETLLSNWA